MTFREKLDERLTESVAAMIGGTMMIAGASLVGAVLGIFIRKYLDQKKLKELKQTNLKAFTEYSKEIEKLKKLYENRKDIGDKPYLDQIKVMENMWKTYVAKGYVDK